MMPFNLEKFSRSNPAYIKQVGEEYVLPNVVDKLTEVFGVKRRQSDFNRTKQEFYTHRGRKPGHTGVTNLGMNYKYQSATDPRSKTNKPSSTTTERDIRIFKLQQYDLNDSGVYEQLANGAEPQIPIDVKVSVTEQDEIDHFNLQNDKCFYCGRELFGGEFPENCIHLEHLIDKARWIKQITEAQQDLLVYIEVQKEVPSDPNVAKMKEYAEIIASTIDKNAVNSLQNWMYADVECNYSKFDMGYIEFIKFMTDINNVSPSSEEVIEQNKKIYEQIASSTQMMSQEQKDFNLSFGIKSLELTLESLNDIMRSENIPSSKDWSRFDSIPGDDVSTIKKKILILLKEFNKAEYSYLKKSVDFNLINRTFNNLQLTKVVKDFARNKVILSSKEYARCPICSIEVKFRSPLSGLEEDQSNDLILFDATMNVKDFQLQLAHPECARRCTKISLKQLKYLAYLIAKYTPYRTEIQKKLGANINDIYNQFKSAADSLHNLINASPYLSQIKDKKENDLRTKYESLGKPGNKFVYDPPKRGRPSTKQQEAPQVQVYNEQEATKPAAQVRVHQNQKTYVPELSKKIKSGPGLQSPADKLRELDRLLGAGPQSVFAKTFNLHKTTRHGDDSD